MVALETGMILIDAEGREQKVFKVTAAGKNIHVGQIVRATVGDSVPSRELTLPVAMPTTLDRLSINGLQVKASMQPVPARWFELV